MLSPAEGEWRKARVCSSGDGSNCVEVRVTSHVELVRDSKNPGAVLLLPSGAISALASGRVNSGG
jgi:hypothetical protein